MNALRDTLWAQTPSAPPVTAVEPHTGAEAVTGLGVSLLWLAAIIVLMIVLALLPRLFKKTPHPS